MDHGESAIRNLIAGLWWGGAAALAGAAVPPLFETLRWTAPGAQLEALSTQPPACLSYTRQDGPMVQAGQALFNTPTLLGGQAAKAGLNCASCHVNGRDNPHFMLTGVSDRPGTADVTNSFFSAARGNGRFDPVRIPDLAAPGKVSREPKAKALEPFIRTLIVEEFAGQEPSPAVLEALAAYVRAIQSCPGDDKMPVQRMLADQLLLVQSALKGAIEMAKRGDAAATRVLIAAARHQLGLVSERYAGGKFKRENALLLAGSRELQALADQAESPQQLAEAANQWLIRFNANSARQLARKEAQSLYNPGKLGFVAPQRKSR